MIHTFWSEIETSPFSAFISRSIWIKSKFCTYNLFYFFFPNQAALQIYLFYKIEIGVQRVTICAAKGHRNGPLDRKGKTEESLCTVMFITKWRLIFSRCHRVSLASTIPIPPDRTEACWFKYFIWCIYYAALLQPVDVSGQLTWRQTNLKIQYKNKYKFTVESNKIRAEITWTIIPPTVRQYLKLT